MYLKTFDNPWAKSKKFLHNKCFMHPATVTEQEAALFAKIINTDNCIQHTKWPVKNFHIWEKKDLLF